MSNYEIYAQSIDGVTLALNTLDEAGFPKENMQDRNEKTLWKCDTANTSGYITIDFGAQRTIDYLLLGNHNYTDTGKGIKLSYDDADNPAFGDETFSVGAGGSYHDYVSGNADRWYETFTSRLKRYWRLYLEAMGAATNQEIGTIFMGAHWNWAHEPELIQPEDSGYPVTLNQAGGGSRYSQVSNTTVRRTWGIPLEYIVAAEKTKHETFRDQIFMDENGGLSRYPFYWSDDDGTTFYYSRYRGNLHLEQQAYQAWKTQHVFEEEL